MNLMEKYLRKLNYYNTEFDSGKVKPVKAILDEKYKSLMEWLKGYPVTDVEIKESMPEHYQKIQDAITEMDSHYYNENLQGFTEAMDKVKGLYLQAVSKSENHKNSEDTKSSASL